MPLSVSSRDTARSASLKIGAAPTRVDGASDGPRQRRNRSAAKASRKTSVRRRRAFIVAKTKRRPRDGASHSVRANRCYGLGPAQYGKVVRNVESLATQSV